MFTHQLFEAQAKETPDNVAVVFEEQSISYRELDCLANQLARRLRSLGVVPEVPVGICMERSVELVIAVLALLKAGGVYVPLDPSNPKERLSFIVNETRPKVVLTQERLLQCLPELDAKSICLDKDRSSVSVESDDPVENLTHSDNLGFLIYTSGSTGEPKAVMLPHRPRDPRTSHEQKLYRMTADDRHILKSSISFTLIIRELFWPLLTGARLIISPPGTETDIDYLLQLIAKHQISIITLTPSNLRAILSQSGLERCDSLRHIVCFGEPLTADLRSLHFAKLSAELSLYYGATEAPSATYCECHPFETRSITELGQTLPGVQLHLLNESLESVPDGICGEIYLGGKLARGYFKRPDLTAEKFIPHPFSQEPGARLYKTGDLGRLLPGGSIEFVGRVDDLVKVRGFRIELGEIAKTIRQHPEINDAVVLALDVDSDRSQIVAYTVPNQKSTISAADLRAFVRLKLPDYMVPARFIFLEALPVSLNGKIDRKALPMPGRSRPEIDTTFVAARTSNEKKLQKIWSETLSIEPIGVHDNFFALGGHSLLAVKLITEIEKAFTKHLAPAVLFQAPTIEQLAEIIRHGPESWSNLVPIQIEGRKRPFFWIHGDSSNAYLPRYLGTDQPLYGLEHQSQDGKPARYTSVESIAANYLREIRSVQAQGQYYLGGYSFGGLVALEMAQQLKDQAQEVAFLALLDPPRPFKLGDKISPRLSQGPSSTNRFLSGLHRHYTNVKSLGYKSGIAYLWERCAGKINDVSSNIGNKVSNDLKRAWIKVCLTAGKDIPPSVRSRYILDLYQRITPKYELRPYSGRVILFKSDDHSEDYLKKWEQYLIGEKQLYEVPGGHMEIREERYIRSWAEILKACLEAAQVNATPSDRKSGTGRTRNPAV